MEIEGTRSAISWAVCIAYFGSGIGLLATIFMTVAKGTPTNELSGWFVIWGAAQTLAAYPIFKLSRWIDRPRTSPGPGDEPYEP